MTKIEKRIDVAYGKIYAMGDTGLDYMDGHVDMDQALMEHFYNDTVNTLSKAEQESLANILEQIASDAEFELEPF
jgi:hypothetical protein